jgi:hypothetical protein
MRFPARGSQAIKYYILRTAGTHSRAGLTSLLRPEAALLSPQSIALGIRPCISQATWHRMGAYKHPTPSPYWPPNCRFVRAELPTLYEAKV